MRLRGAAARRRTREAKLKKVLQRHTYKGYIPQATYPCEPLADRLERLEKTKRILLGGEP